MPEYNISILIDAKGDAAEALKQVNAQLDKTGKAASKNADETGKLTSAYEGFQAKILPAVAVLGTFAGALMAVNKAAREGMIVAQSADNFERLAGGAENATAQMTALQRASGGMISDMALQQGAVMAVAGASDELAASLEGALPQLVEIAVAAQRLQPAAGDVNYFFESIITGIKRGSPMIIDNLGITMKLGEAYESYAASIGKAADELTANEQKVAIMNEVLRSGATIIEQAGSAAEVAGGQIGVMDANIENMTNNIKTRALPFLDAFAAGMNNVFFGGTDKSPVLQGHEQEMQSVAQNWDEYANEMARVLAVATGHSEKYFSEQIRQAKTTEEAASIAALYGLEVVMLTQAQFEQAKATEVAVAAAEAWGDSALRMSMKTQEATPVVTGLAAAAEAVARAYDGAAHASEVFSEALTIGADSAEQARLRKLTLALAMGEIDQKQMAAALAAEQLNKALADGTITWAEYKNAVAGGEEAIMALAGSLGQTADAGERAVLKVKELTRVINDIPIRKSVDIAVVISGANQAIAAGLAQEEVDMIIDRQLNVPQRAIGGPVSRNQPYLVGERGPELFVPSQSGQIVSNGDMQTGHTFNIHIHGGGDATVQRAVRQGIDDAMRNLQRRNR